MGISDLVKDVKWLVEQLADYPEKERINALNEIRAALHEVSPFKNEPIDLVLWVPAGEVQANDYNPNTVAPPEMRLLETSIVADGYTQPIVTFPEPGDDREYTVIDGFHRNRVGKESAEVRQRVKGYLPIVLAGDASTPKENRMASTIRHNRARGKHGVTAMSEIVVELARRNWSDDKIAKELGMDADEVLRLKQITGLAEMFADREFSEAWDV
ncbi:ParB/RepB/Spo0J family partition protein [Paenibacillus sp. Pae108]|uniref:IbrB-like domain-containing protein n=1 Tax=Paenibacillus sp. Pae108 TaxID=2926019 RepID=UPI002119370D|nr:ParB/RepB/Spo0J family partition protein [Paenibacillus sp. Pae108]